MKHTIKQAIAGYDNWLYTEGKANATITAYMSDIELFTGFLKHILNNRIHYIEDLSKVEIVQYKNHLLSLNMTEASINRKFNAFKMFLKYCKAVYGLDLYNAGEKITRGWNGGKNAIPSVLTQGDLQKLTKALNASTDRNSVRDRALFYTLIFLGVRRSELLELKWEDISFREDTIKVFRPKTQNTDILPLNDTLKEVLMALYYIGKANTYVFMSNQGTRLSTTAFNQVIKKYVALSGINPATTAHTLRHTFITKCLSKDISTAKILRYTGHTRADSLNPYTHLITKDLDPIAQLDLLA